MKHLKSEFDKLTMKEFIMYMTAVVMIGASLVAIFLSLYIPPEGEVHGSVLTYFGMTTAFVGMLLGISMHYSNQLQMFKGEVNEHVRRAVEAVSSDVRQSETSVSGGSGASGPVFRATDDRMRSDKVPDAERWPGLDLRKSGDSRRGDSRSGDSRSGAAGDLRKGGEL